MGVLGEGYTCAIVGLLTKQYPVSLLVSPEMDHFKATPCPASLIQLSRGVLNMSHMVGAAPFP